MSDVEEEELAALRAAALATLNKPKSSSNNSVDPSGSKNVASISTVMASASYSSYNAGDQSNYSSQYSWRNQSQNNRRGRGGRPFPKVNQRSNLIVITPIASEEKNSDGKSSSSQLVLPQHKWCQSINEDSSSPRSYKKTGPTRFNRHESDSDSSDSEPELSDNDSYSNETILQDEPSDHYAARSGRSISPESSPEKSSERRLSFQNIDSDSFPNMESTSVYKCLKNTYNKSDKRLELRSPSVENENESSWKRGSDRKYPYSQSDNVADRKQSHGDDSSKSLNGESSRKHKLSSVLSEAEHSSRPETEVFRDGSSSPKSNRSGGLSKNDLRLELKKRMHEMQQNLQAQGHQGDRARSSSRSPSNRHRRAARSRSRSTNGHRSRSVDRSHSRRRSHSPERRHGRRTNRRKRKGRSPSPVSDRSKTEKTRSPHRNSKRNRSSSSDHSRKERSHSPRRGHRRGHSSSSDRSQKDRSRSPRPNRKRVDSPLSEGSRKDRSRSPRPNRKRVDSPLSEGSRKGRSRSPRPNRKRVDSPLSEGSRKDRSRSPRPNRKRVDSPLSKGSRKDRSRSPHPNRKRGRSSSSDRSRKDQSHSPAKNHRRGRSLSSDRDRSSPNNRKSPVYSRHNSHRDRVSQRHRNRSSSESSYSSRHSSVERLRSVSSVVKPVSVISKVEPKERTVSSESDSQYPREKIKLDRVKPLVSSGKPLVENKNNASDGQKRVPVHMRLGSLPGKRVIQMTKDVEAAFVNTSSDEGGDESNGRHKKDSLHVMHKANDSKNDESSKRHAHRNVVQSDTFKEGRFKHRR